MRRTKLDELIAWKSAPGRKPLIIRGARQVGKTWLMREFGRTQYRQTVYINFESSRRLKNLFSDDFDIRRAIRALQAESGMVITPDDTLLIFDEIQAVPEAITALKYFCEQGPEYHLVAAGSLLGLAIHEHVFFPVGKVAFLDLHPLSFEEFLEACDEHALLEMLQIPDWELITSFKSRYIERLRQYYYVGGMPEAVRQFSTDGDFTAVRRIQQQILDAYDQDFSKHAPLSIVPRIRMVWNSIPAQLAKENRKFIYGQIREGSRAKDYELALSWLVDCGQAYKIHRVTKPGLPLKAYEDLSAFKLFMVDVGLLSAMGGIEAQSLVSGNALLAEFKGALTEQFVLQQLVSSGNYALYYWSAERATAEVDFVVQYKDHIIPLEVKAEENLRSRSLRVFHDTFHPRLSVRVSMSDYRQQDWMCNLPLYAIAELGSLF
jgi:uncharacterized protein